MEKSTILEERMEIFYEMYQDQKYLESLESLKNIFLENSRQNLEKYPESIEAYNRMISDTAKLCQELKLKDSMSIFVVFNYLLWNGYFSKNKTYHYTVWGRKNMAGYQGIDIVNGSGVCLNKSEMLSRLLKSMGYEAYMVLNKPSKGMKREYKPDIDRQTKKQGMLALGALAFFLKPLTVLIGNHACVLIKREDVYYVYDPTNLCVYKLNNFLEATILGGTGNISIKPFLTGCHGDLTGPQIIEMVDSYKNIGSEKEPYDSDSVKDSFEENLQLCQKHITLLDDFYDSEEPRRRKVLEIFKK